MSSLVLAGVIATSVALVALVLRRSRVVDAPTQRSFSVPAQLDRADFGSPTEEWLIVVFTSSTCPVCADVSDKVSAMSSKEVATRSIEFESHRDLHRRYGIDAVPAVVVADRTGVVRHHVLGPVTATDLWAAVATVREGGSDDGVPECSGQ